MSNKPEPWVEIKQVTPEWAMKIMERHSQQQAASEFRQRPLNHKTTILYSTDMKVGNWGLTGQGLTFDVNGHLLDGQNRLAAVVRAGVIVPLVILWNAPERINDRLKTIDVFDCGRKRSLANQLSIEGFKYQEQIASASRLMLVLARGGMDWRSAVSSPQGVAVAMLLQHHLFKLIEILKANNAPKIKIGGKILAPLCLLRTADPDNADLFASEFNEMANLRKTSPVLHFQKFLDRGAKYRNGSDYLERNVAACASALYCYCNEKEVELIKGNREHLQWLLKTSKNAVAEIRRVAGITLTMDELKQKETYQN